ncbi:MAG: inner-rane translocator [Rhizobium sp.]|nr:inner-rane translocator [Rhizobium sp.]
MSLISEQIETRPATVKLGEILTRNAQVIVLVLLIVAAGAFERGFYNRLNFYAIAYQYSVIGLLALGQLAVILTRGIDLSQGSLIAVSSMVAALTAPYLGLPGCIAAAIVASMLLGLINGAIVTWTRVPAFVATLGMMGLGRGIALTLTNSNPVPLPGAGFHSIAWGKVGLLPVPFILFIASGIALALFLSRWPLGRHFYAVGGHEENARLSGISIASVKLAAYGISGLLCGIGGLIVTSRMGTGHPLSGMNYELESIAAVIVGGASLFGGTGRVTSVIAGALILGVANSIINLSGVSPYLQGTLKGAIILIAVALSQINFKAMRSGR